MCKAERTHNQQLIVEELNPLARIRMERLDSAADVTRGVVGVWNMRARVLAPIVKTLITALIICLVVVTDTWRSNGGQHNSAAHHHHSIYPPPCPWQWESVDMMANPLLHIASPLRPKKGK